MRAIRLTTKFFAIAAILAVVFGPFGALTQTPLAFADTPANGPYDAPTGLLPSDPNYSGTYFPTVDGHGQTAFSNGTAIDSATGKPNSQAPTNNTECSGITGCLASMVYYVGPGFASWVASWSAYFFDFIVRISLNSAAYTLSFLTESWNLVLSLANMFFIFILIYAAFVIMLRAETARTLQTLAWVIAIALVVNFSFFFTRVVIDAGNIIGVQFYNAVAQQRGVDNLPAGNSGAAATPDITKPIMSAIGVEQLIGGQSFALLSDRLGGDQWGALIVLTVIFLFAAVMFWILAVALLMVGLKFFLRVVGLWLVLVASPLAFVAQTLSNTRHFFDMWLRTLISLSMYPAVFLFMFWVLNQFAAQLAGGTDSIQNKLLGANGQAALGQAVGAVGSADNTYTLLVLIANVSIRMMFIITMLYIMLKVSDWIIEQAGGMASTFINRGSAAILGSGFRSAAWAGAFAGRNTVGRGAFGVAQSNLKNAAPGSLSNRLWRGASALSRSTFDIRNTPGASAVGTRLGALSRTSDVNTGRASQRTFAQSVDDKAKRLTQQAEALKATPSEAWHEQNKVEQEFDRRNGQGAFVKRVGQLENRYSSRLAAAERLKQKAGAATTPEQAKAFKSLAEKGERDAKQARNELGQMQLAGARVATINEKNRLGALANSLDKSGKEKVFMPGFRHLEPVSHGAIAAAAAIRSMAEPKEKKEKKAAAAPSASPAAPAAATATASTPAAAAAPAPVVVATPTAPAAAPAPVVVVTPASPAATPASRPVMPVAPATSGVTRQDLQNLRASLTKDVHGAIAAEGRRFEAKMDDVSHRQNLETHDQLKKLEKQITKDLQAHGLTGPDGGGTGPSAGALPKPMEPLDGDVPPHYREAAE